MQCVIDLKMYACAWVRLLHINQEVTLEDEFPLLVFLGGFVCSVIFPSKSSPAFAAVNVSDGMVARGHWPIIRFSFNHIDDYVEEIRSPMLTIEGPRDHRVNRGKMCLASGASIDALSCKVLAITQAHPVT